MLADAGEHRGPPCATAHELHHLHRGDHEGEAGIEGQPAGVARNAVDPQPAGARPPLQLGDERGIGVHSGDGVPPGGEVERHPAGAATDVEHRPSASAASSRQCSRSAA